MRSFFLYVSLRCATAVLAGAIVIVGGMTAQASCFTSGRQLPAVTINTFLNDPAHALAQDPDGGGRMIAQLRDLVASDPKPPQVLQAVLSLVGKANKDQKSAIGTALAYAARICVRVDQAYATQIQEAIAQSNDQEFILAYSAASGELPIASVNPAGVSLGGGVTGASGSTGLGTVFGNSTFSSPTTFGPHSFTFSSSVTPANTFNAPSRRVSP